MNDDVRCQDHHGGFYTHLSTVKLAIDRVRDSRSHRDCLHLLIFRSIVIADQDLKTFIPRPGGRGKDFVKSVLA